MIKRNSSPRSHNVGHGSVGACGGGGVQTWTEVLPNRKTGQGQRQASTSEPRSSSSRNRAEEKIEFEF